MSLNKVMLIGHLDDKPQIREIEQGRKMVGLALVTTRHEYDPEAGEELVGREWHRVVVTEERLAAFAETHLQQNDHVYIQGQLHTERWQDEIYQWRSLSKILLSHKGDQLRKLTPDDGQVPGIGPRDPMQADVREAHLIETTSLDARLEKAVPVCAC